MNQHYRKKSDSSFKNNIVKMHIVIKYHLKAILFSVFNLFQNMYLMGTL